MKQASTDAPPLRLPARIHPLWRRENFRMMDWEDSQHADDWSYAHPMETRLYTRLKPALQLATQLMEQAKPAYLRVMYAAWVACRGGTDGVALSSDTTSYAHLAGVYDAALLSLAQKFRIYQCSFVRLQAYGATASRRQTGSATRLAGREAVRLSLCAEAFAVLAAKSWTKADARAKHVALFAIAVTLVHELAHVLWSVRMWDEAMVSGSGESHCSIPEPLLDAADAGGGELGLAIERYLLGGGLSLPCGDAVGRVQFDGSQSVDLELEGGRWVKVVLASISRLFDGRFWQSCAPGHLPLEVMAYQNADGVALPGRLSRVEGGFGESLHGELP